MKLTLKSLIILSLQILLFGLLLTFNFMAIFSISEILDASDIINDLTISDLQFIHDIGNIVKSITFIDAVSYCISIICLLLLTGIWITFGLQHCRPRQAWGVFSLLLLLCISAQPVCEIVRCINDQTYFEVNGSYFYWLCVLILRVSITVIFIACSLIGVLPGRILIHLSTKSKRIRWRKLYRKLHKKKRRGYG